MITIKDVEHVAKLARLELSDEEKEQYEDTFDDDERIDKEISNTAINKWLFNADTIDLDQESFLNLITPQ